MSHVTITLPDGSDARGARGHAGARTSPRRHLPQSVVKKALAAVVDGRLVDLSLAARRRRVAAARHARRPRGAGALPALDGAPAGRGGHAAVSRRAVRHRPGHRRGLLLRLRRAAPVRARGPRGDRGEDARAGRRRTCVYERQMWPRDEAIAFFAQRGEPLKVQLIEEKTEGQPSVSCYTIKDRETFVDFCVGPHVPSTGRLKAFKLLDTSNAYWKGDAQQPADAAHLRHGVLQRRRPEAAPAADRGSEEARPPASSARTWACSCSTRGRRARRSGWARARRSTTRWPTTCARCSSPPATSR